MFEVGMEFKRNGILHTVLAVLTYENENYILLSGEKEKLDYQYYKVTENGNNLDLDVVEDPILISFLDEMVEGGKNE